MTAEALCEKKSRSMTKLPVLVQFGIILGLTAYLFDALKLMKLFLYWRMFCSELLQELLSFM
jgi:hypothetical protein